MTARLRLNVGMKSSGDDKTLSIGDLAERFGLATHVLRHWETMACCPRTRRRRPPLPHPRGSHPPRQESGPLPRHHPLSGRHDQPRRTAGHSAPGAETLRSHIAAALASLELIECALECDHEDFTQCSHFRQMVAECIGPDAPVAVPTVT
ncbi:MULTISPECIES: MerR family transcriptional regulator [Streptomyces]|uniref:MerR family transcriptional regulator n=1 Tax=Streptomyces TaxID=1883 RepID=UPI00345FE78B